MVWNRSKHQSSAASCLWGSVQISCQSDRSAIEGPEGAPFFKRKLPLLNCKRLPDYSLFRLGNLEFGDLEFLQTPNSLNWAAGRHCAQRRLYNCGILKNGARGKHPPKGYRPSELFLSLPLHCTKWNAEIGNLFQRSMYKHSRQIRNLHISLFS